jgi:prepilin-type N-terminal cleavage/methylation domain-containing protein
MSMQTVIKKSDEIGNKKQKGFSLIELLIVVAIILIIAAIAIPNLLRSRMAANEASAVGSIRTINTSAVTYSTTYPNAGFPGYAGADEYGNWRRFEPVKRRAEERWSSSCSRTTPQEMENEHDQANNQQNVDKARAYVKSEKAE